MATKPASITLRVTSEFKRLAMHRAKSENRSLTSYMEWLVLQDAQRNRDQPELASKLISELPVKGLRNNLANRDNGNRETIHKSLAEAEEDTRGLEAAGIAPRQ